MSTQGRGIVDTASSHRYLSSTEVTKKTCLKKLLNNLSVLLILLQIPHACMHQLVIWHYSFHMQPAHQNKQAKFRMDMLHACHSNLF